MGESRLLITKSLAESTKISITSSTSTTIKSTTTTSTANTNPTASTPELWNCPFDYHETRPNPEPTNKLRTDHFLINLSPFGPNNQFRGFRDTILLAYILNRTIVLPLFFKHNSDPSQTK